MTDELIFNFIEPDELSSEQVDFVIDVYPDSGIVSVKHQLNERQFNAIVIKYPGIAAQSLRDHPFLTQEHIDHIVKTTPQNAVGYLSDKLSEENLEYLAINHPEYYERLFE